MHPMEGKIMGGYLIQSEHGQQGNFEVVVPAPHGGGLALYVRENDNNSNWVGPFCFGVAKEYVGACVIQSNYGSIGNLEVAAVDTAGNLDVYWRLDVPPYTWHGPDRIGTNTTGTPSLIQSTHGNPGNFEIIVPTTNGGLRHYVRNNDTDRTWDGPFSAGGNATYQGASVIQSNYGSIGNLEVVALTAANDLDFTWRMDTPPWTWDGLHRIGSEVTFPVAECVYSWDAGYLQLGTHVVIRIQHVLDPAVDPATLAALQTTWRAGIISKWSNIFDCTAPNGDRRPLTFDVQWVTSGAHHVVQVIPGPARSNMTTWDTSDTGAVASHEFGHMLGHPDEYPDPVCPTRSPVNTGSVMDDNSETVSRHYQRIAGAHCGHNPSARTSARGKSEGEPAKMQFLDELDPSARRTALAKILALAEPSAAPDPSTLVIFEVTGGAPSERYHYRIQISADGAAERSISDELTGASAPTIRSVASRSETARIFAALASVGMLADKRPRFTPIQQLMPDSLLVTLRLRHGDLIRQVSIPASEGALPPGFSEIPLRAKVGLPTEAAQALEPLLQALSEIDGTMP